MKSSGHASFANCRANCPVEIPRPEAPCPVNGLSTMVLHLVRRVLYRWSLACDIRLCCTIQRTSSPRQSLRFFLSRQVWCAVVSILSQPVQHHVSVCPVCFNQLAFSLFEDLNSCGWLDWQRIFASANMNVSCMRALYFKPMRRGQDRWMCSIPL